MASMATSTKGQYETHIRRFQIFCSDKDHMDPLLIPCSLAIEFLTSMFDSGLSYSSINSARSAISQFSCLIDSSHQFGKHPLTTRFMRGVYRLRPPLPKYNTTWDVGPVLRHLESLDCSDLKTLTHKCVMLIALTTGQRVQTINSLDLNFMTLSPGKVCFAIREVLKTSKPGSSFSLETNKYSVAETNICPFACLMEYLDATKPLRTSNKLFVSYLKPHRPVSAQTISRWLTNVLNRSGVDTSYGSHSVRHASTSKAASLNVHVDIILRMAGWSSERTFACFYRRKITPSSSKVFTQAVLGESTKQD